MHFRFISAIFWLIGRVVSWGTRLRQLARRTPDAHDVRGPLDEIAANFTSAAAKYFHLVGSITAKDAQSELSSEFVVESRCTFR